MREHALRKPVESRRAYKQRKNTVALGMILALLLAAALAVLLAGGLRRGFLESKESRSELF